MSTLITFVFHHIGKLDKDSRGRLQYIGKEVTEIERVNVDTLNIFFVEGLLMDIEYTGFKECYWLKPGMELDGGLRLLRRDMDVVKMCEATIKNGNRVHLYFEHPMVDNPKVVDVSKALECSPSHTTPPHNTSAYNSTPHTTLEVSPLKSPGGKVKCCANKKVTPRKKK